MTGKYEVLTAKLTGKLQEVKGWYDDLVVQVGQIQAAKRNQLIQKKTYTYIYIYIYLYFSRYLAIKDNVYIHIYRCIYVHICIMKEAGDDPRGAADEKCLLHVQKLGGVISIRSIILMNFINLAHAITELRVEMSGMMDRVTAEKAKPKESQSKAVLESEHIASESLVVLMKSVKTKINLLNQANRFILSFLL